MVPVRMWGGGVLGFGVSGSGLPALAYTLAESSFARNASLSGA